MKLSDCKTISERAQFIENTLNLTLTHIQNNSVDTDEQTHCENRVGSVAIPLGVAGPFNVQGEYAKGERYVPLATTEGALVASVSRGAKATHEKGIIVSVDKVGVTRGPVLKAKTVGGAQKIEKWIGEHRVELGEKAKESSGHIHLMDVVVKRAGLYIFIRFSFDTDRAMGMNMATLATERLIEYISKYTECEPIAVAGNYDIDKKPAWLNSIYGRGYMASAEAIVSSSAVKNVLKTTPQKLFEVWKAKCLIGSALAGSIGFNAHHANIIAAFYCATGQDLAHTVEGSLGMTIVDILADGSLYISVNIPSIMVGTIGGGTMLTTQTEARAITQQESPMGLAEIVSAAVLAGELSLLASLSEGTLASTHRRLGR
jgi:hydroxymethylglutaryl-CoA reductase (NADPH)